MFSEQGRPSEAVLIFVPAQGAWQKTYKLGAKSNFVRSFGSIITKTELFNVFLRKQVQVGTGCALNLRVKLI